MKGVAQMWNTIRDAMAVGPDELERVLIEAVSTAEGLAAVRAANVHKGLFYIASRDTNYPAEATMLLCRYAMTCDSALVAFAAHVEDHYYPSPRERKVLRTLLAESTGEAKRFALAHLMGFKMRNITFALIRFGLALPDDDYGPEMRELHKYRDTIVQQRRAIIVFISLRRFRRSTQLATMQIDLVLQIAQDWWARVVRKMQNRKLRIEYALNSPEIATHFDSDTTSITYCGIAPSADEETCAVRAIDVVGAMEFDALAAEVDRIISTLSQKERESILSVRERTK